MSLHISGSVYTGCGLCVSSATDCFPLVSPLVVNCPYMYSHMGEFFNSDSLLEDASAEIKLYESMIISDKIGRP